MSEFQQIDKSDIRRVVEEIVNDTVGHDAGDRLLRGVAERLVAAIREDDLAARLGGDEFAVLLGEGPDARRAKVIADRIAASLQLPFQLAEREFSIGASIGLAIGHAGQDAQDTHSQKSHRRSPRDQCPRPSESGLQLPEKNTVGKHGADDDCLGDKTGGHDVVAVKIA